MSDLNIISYLIFNSQINELGNNVQWITYGNPEIKQDYIELGPNKYLGPTVAGDIWKLGTSDFTFRIIFNLSDNINMAPLFCTPNNGCGLFVYNGYINWYLKSNTSSWDWDMVNPTNAPSSIPINTDTWYDVLFTRQGNMVYGHINNTQDIAVNVGNKTVADNGANSYESIGIWTGGATNADVIKIKKFICIKGTAFANPNLETSYIYNNFKAGAGE